MDIIVSVNCNYYIFNILQCTNRSIKIGCRLPTNCILKYQVYFSDQNWKNPNLEKYSKAVEKNKPHIATVIDYDNNVNFNTVLNWANTIAPFVNKIIIIPKIPGTIKNIPTSIQNKDIILGYSVPSTYGQSEVNIQEFYDRPTHLLGGSFKKQIQIIQKYKNALPIVSLDNNYFLMKANKFAEYWEFPSEKFPLGTWKHVSGLYKDYCIPEKVLSTGLHKNAAIAMYISICNFYDYIQLIV